MAEKDGKRPAQSPGTTAPSGTAETGSGSNDVWPDLDSEAFAHLQINSEQFRTHVNAFTNGIEGSNPQQLIDDLSRMRNTAVILEKPATEFVLSELSSLLDSQAEDCNIAQDDLNSVLNHAAVEVADHIAVMCQDTSMDNALALVPLVNDCRACRQEMLISDVLMLVAGIRARNIHSTSASENDWLEQRELWLDQASRRYESLARCLNRWQCAVNTEPAEPLILELENLASFTAQHSALVSLNSLFQSAALLVQAISDGQLVYGPALKSVFVHIEQTLSIEKPAEMPEDLVPADLLRNCLYYVAQIDLASPAASALRRRFRLDRVRQLAAVEKPPCTPTIGVAYHLASAIRSGIARETASLRAWLEAAENQAAQNVMRSKAENRYVELPPETIRLRVRLQQMQPVLTLLGASQAVQCLHDIIDSLQSRPRGERWPESVRGEMAASLGELDTLLDQAARQSVRCRHPGTSMEPSAGDAFTDMAVDACLREARIELQSFTDQILELMLHDQLDIQAARQSAVQLNSIGSALQILPLPEVEPLLSSLGTLLTQQHSPGEDSAQSKHAQRLKLVATGESPDVIAASLATVLQSLDEYLGCVMQPQPDASQFLNEADEALEQLLLVLSAETEQVFDQEELSLSDVGSMTLNVEDELLFDEYEDESLLMDSTLDLLYQNECIDQLDMLEQSVNRALTPSDNLDVRLPNEQMLRALHTLTASSQTMDAADIMGISQPLQRAALALHREGRYFGAGETRFIGKLVHALRLRLESMRTGAPVDNSVIDLEKQLNSVLRHAVTGIRDIANEQSQTPRGNTPLRSPDDVFYEEATELLDQLRAVIKTFSFDSNSINKALSIVHTLKGSARMIGNHPLSDCAHVLEAEIQSCNTNDEKLSALKDGYRALQAYLSRSSAHWVSDMSTGQPARTSSLSARFDEDVFDADGQHDTVLDLVHELSVKQTRLGDELAALRSAGRDIEASLLRWRRVRQNAPSQRTAAIDQFTTDLETSSDKLRTALVRADKGFQQASRSSATLQHALIRARLVRFDSVRQRLAETIADVAACCHVEVRLQLTGGELMVERMLLKQLATVLDHLARNAIVHGIEAPEQRSEKNKPGAGTISLTATTDGCDLVIVMADDGCGIDINAVNALLGERGAARIENDDELQKLLFSSGYSSVNKPDALAGHGLGLSAVRTAMDHLHGSVELENRTHQGVCVTLRVPQAIVVCRAVLVQEGDRLYAVPVSVVESVQLATDRANDSAKADRPAARNVTLSSLLGHESPPEERQALAAMHGKTSLRIAHRDNVVNMAVDKLIGYRELVLQPLGLQIASLGQFTAGSIDSSGEQVLIVDLPALLDGVQLTHRDSSGSTEKNNSGPVVLVIDGSPTSRSRAQAMLQSRGVTALVCHDAEEALEHMTSSCPDLLLVDMDLPGIRTSTLLRQSIATHSSKAPPWIALHGFNDNQMRDAAIQSGAAVCLSKPWTHEDLQRAMESAGLRLVDLTIA